MLKKLMKYEFQATARLLIPFYVVVVALSVMVRLSYHLNILFTTNTNTLWSNIVVVLFGLLTAAYVLAIVVMFSSIPLFSIYRYYKNLLKDEGYLMMTLPVKISQHIWSKLHTMSVWTLGSVMVGIVSIFVLTVGTPVGSLLYEIISVIPTELELGFFEIIMCSILALLTLIFYLYLFVMRGYACLAIGHKFSRQNPIFGAIGAYLLISFVTQVIAVMAIFLIGVLSINISSDQWLLSLSTSTLIYGSLLINTTISGLLFSTFYFITKKLMSQSLNLE